MTELDIYLLTRLDNLHCILPLTIFLSCVWLFILYFAKLSIPKENAGEIKSNKRISLVLGIIFCISLILKLLVPTSTEMSMIYLIPKITTEDKIKSINNTFDKINNLLSLSVEYNKEMVNAIKEELK